MMVRRFLSVIVSCMLLAGAAHAADADKAKSFVDGLASRVMAIVKDDAFSRTDKQTRIEQLFVDKVDINFVARFVLGKHWRTATPQQQKEYVTAYRPFILKNYAGRLAKYSGQTYELRGSRNDGDASIVTMEIIDPQGQNVMVDYRLRSEGGGFKVVDITVEGVSLLTTQRSEFNGIVERKGVDGLIAALKSQVAGK
jgi:phospholipid transport system substrate-binding protein